MYTVVTSSMINMLPAVERQSQAVGTRIWVASGRNYTVATATAVASTLTTNRLVERLLPVVQLSLIQRLYSQPLVRLNNFSDRHMQRRSMIMVTQTKANSDPDLPVVDNSNQETTTTTTTTTSTNSSQSMITNMQPHQQDLSVIVTDACYQRIHHLISQKKKQGDTSTNNSNDYYLRVFVDAGGCSGFTYQFELDTDDTINPTDDVIFTEEPTTATAAAASAVVRPARVIIDKGSLHLLAGSKIDYVQEMIKSTFEVRENPQSESACGCGSSFAVKNFTSNPAID